jgi:thioesterase domain-containing protein
MYRECVKYIGDDLPVYSLKSVELNGMNKNSLKFEDIAARYIEEIRKFKPHGPYNIGGYCVGGTVALEVAQQIIEQGEKINHLAMIENYNISLLQNSAQSNGKQYIKFLDMYFNILDIFSSKNDTKIIFRHNKNKAKPGELQFSFKKNLSVFGSRHDKKQSTDINNLKTREAYIKALLSYKPQSYPGRINLFISKNKLNGFSNSNYGWDDIAEKGVNVHTIDALPKTARSHPYLKYLAVKLKMTLSNP